MTNHKYELGNTNIICQYHERHIENRIDFYQDKASAKHFLPCFIYHRFWQALILAIDLNYSQIS